MRIKNPYKVRHYQVGGEVTSAITQNPVGLEGFTGGYESAVTPKWESLHNFNSPYGATVGSAPVTGNAVGSASQPANIEELTQYAKDNSVALNKEIKAMTPEQIQWWKDTMGFGDTWDWLTNLIGGDKPVADNPYEEGTPAAVAYDSNVEKGTAMADAAASDSGLWAQITGNATGGYEQGLTDYDLETRPDSQPIPQAPVDPSIFADEPVAGVETPLVTAPTTGEWHPGVGNPPVVVNTPTPVAPPQLSIDAVEEIIASQPNITVSQTPAPVATDPVVTDYGDSWHPGVGSDPVVVTPVAQPPLVAAPTPVVVPPKPAPVDTGWHPGVGNAPVVIAPPIVAEDNDIVHQIGTGMGENLNNLVDFGNNLQDRFDGQEQIQKDKQTAVVTTPVTGGWHPGVGSTTSGTDFTPKPEPSKPATSRPEPKPSTQTSKPSVVETFTNWVSSWEW